MCGIVRHPKLHSITDIQKLASKSKQEYFVKLGKMRPLAVSFLVHIGPEYGTFLGQKVLLTDLRTHGPPF